MRRFITGRGRSTRLVKAVSAECRLCGVKLGGFRGRAGTAEECAKASRAKVAKADARALDLAPIFERLDPKGSLSLNEMARRLTAEGLPTVNGSATWSAAGVARVRSRLARA
jgi:hypothetical protein